MWLKATLALTRASRGLPLVGECNFRQHASQLERETTNSLNDTVLMNYQLQSN